MDVALGQRLTDIGRFWIVETAQVGTEFSSPALVTRKPGQFLGPNSEVSVLHRTDVAQPQLGHVPEHFGPPVAPILQPSTRTLDAFTSGLDDGRVGGAVVETRPGHQVTRPSVPKSESHRIGTE